jgi:sec-independent protein translocase protein TatA
MITGHWYVIVVLLLVVLIFYGPGKLPEIGGAVGKAIREFRKSSDAVELSKVAASTAEAPATTTAGGVKASTEGNPEQETDSV